MHIVFLTDNFPPEGNAPANRTFEHAREWVRQGAKVTVITCAPNFPEGSVFEGYKNSWYDRSELEGIEVRRVKTYITANEGFVKRILDYMSFMVMGFLAGLMVRKVDVVIATSPQFFCACAGWLLSVFKRKPFIFELRDIWPASITAVGAMEKSFIIRLLEKLELFLYRRADKIISVTHAFKQELIERGINHDKIEVVLNGVDLSAYKVQEKDAELLSEYNLTGKFVAAYVGTHGLAHALETLVEAAEQLQSRDDIVFLFAGGGAQSNMVANLVREKALNNVRVLGRMDKQLMPRIWSVCDVSLVHLRNADLFRTVIPSKIFEAMGMGLPMIIGVPEGESTGIVRDAGAGIVVEPENAAAIAQAIVTLADSEKEYVRLSEGAVGAATKYDRKTLAVEMLGMIEHCVAQ